MQTARQLAKRMNPPAAADPTRAKLLEAAGRVFAERGYDAATIREMCMRAGANVAAVNYYFRDKLGLYAEVLQQSVRAAQIESMRHALDLNVPPEQALRAAIRARLQTIGSGKLPDWHFRIMAHELAQPSPAMSRIIKTVSRPIYERLLKLVGTIIGSPPGHEKTRLCTHSIMGQIFLYVLAGPVLVRLWPQLKMTPAQLDRIADHITDFSLAYLREARTEYGQMPRVARAGRR
jgi:AcrR family transcriptional regulator